MKTAKPRQSLTGIVGADEERVWAALLETSPYLTPRMREMITGSHGMLRFPGRPADGPTETAPVPWVNVEADNDAHTLAISGQWWFRGVYSMTPQGRDTLLRYQVLNAAPGATRWLVPLVADPVAYEERYRWTRTSGAALVVYAVLILILSVLPQPPLLLRVLFVALCACGTFSSVFVPLTRTVAFRVDASGLTLGGSPLRYKATTRVAPCMRCSACSYDSATQASATCPSATCPWNVPPMRPRSRRAAPGRRTDARSATRSCKFRHQPSSSVPPAACRRFPLMMPACRTPSATMCRTSALSTSARSWRVTRPGAPVLIRP